MVTIAQAAALSSGETITFEHCVALARAGDAKLVSIHVNSAPEASARMPEVGPVLSRWGSEETIEHERLVHVCCDEPVDGLLDAVRVLKPDLVVATTHQHTGLARLLLGSTAQALARNAPVPTLLFPMESAGFVSHSTGEIELRRILVPVGDEAAARAAVGSAVWLADLLGASALELVLLHVGPRGSAGDVDVPHRPGWVVEQRDVQGSSIEDAIVDAAETASLVVMATRGHDSAGDVLLGSHTEQVLRRLRCPLLVVPVRS